MISDRQLRQDVEAELHWEPRVNSAHIGVAAEGGIVTLTGHVASLVEKDSALDATHRVHGVRGVADEIEIRLATASKWHDDEIAKRAAAILHWSMPEVADQVRIDVSHGKVVLAGTVERAIDRIDAESQIRRLTGIFRIENRISVAPKKIEGQVQRQIEAAFERNANLRARNIKVEASGPTVCLTGHIANWYERDLAERAAWAAPGVTHVDNRLQIA